MKVRGIQIRWRSWTTGFMKFYMNPAKMCIRDSSNRGLVSATVSGSNDNFVIKISDSDEAKDAVEKALLASYGSLDRCV